MQLTVTKLGPCRAKVSFSVPSTDLEKEINQALTQQRSQVRIKGFRPGKAPMGMVEKAYGEEIRGRLKQWYLSKAFQQAKDEENLDPFGEPNVTLEELQALEIDPKSDFAYEFEMDLRPDFELAKYKELPIESELAPVLEEEVENAIEQFKRSQSRPEPAGDDGLPEDGMSMCKVELIHDGDVVLEREGMRIVPTDPLPGMDEEAWKEALTGAQEGSEVELSVAQLPVDIEKEEARGQEGTCRIGLTQVFRMVPPTDEEIRKALGVETDDEVRERAKKQLEEQNANIENNRIETVLLEGLVAEHEFDVPESMIEQQREGRLSQLRQQLAAQGLSDEDVEESVASGLPEIDDAATKGAKAFFILEAISKEEKIQVQEKDMVEELKSIAQRNQASFEEVKNFYTENNQIQALALELLERKVRAYLREQASVTTPE